MDPGGFRSLGAGAERTQGDIQKWHRSGAHIHTMCSLPGKRQSSRWKKTVTDALKPRTLRDCRDRQTRGKNATQYPKSRRVWAKWVSAGEFTHRLVKKNQIDMVWAHMKYNWRSICRTACITVYACFLHIKARTTQ